MRNVIFSSIVVSGAAIAAFAVWRPDGVDERVGKEVVRQAPEPTPAERPRTTRAAERSPAATPAAPTAPQPAEPEQTVVDLGNDDDGHHHEQVDPRPLELPPPSREAFGADPAGEAAALAEARAILAGLLEDPDPAVRAKATTLLETIEEAAN